jgi:hypothetical protein
MKNRTKREGRSIEGFTSRYGSILVYLLMGVLATGCATMGEKADCVSPMAGRLAELRTSQPGPDWNSVVRAIEVDYLEPVGED